MQPVRRFRSIGLLMLMLAMVPLLLLAGLVGTSAAVGRTPDEVLAQTGQRANESWPELGDALAPALAAAQTWLRQQAAGPEAMPYAVPPLAPNPGAVAADAPDAAASRPAAAAPAPGPGRVLQVGPQRALRTVAAAAAAARDGDTVEIDPGDYPADVAVWHQTRLTIRGMGARVRLIARGASAEQKAIWVMRGGQIVVEGIDFIGARVRDRNGAGIRFETGHLVVRRCLFIDNENGILASPNGQSVLEVEQSEFGHNGAGDGMSHHLYAGQISLLKVTGSYFHHANQGHLIKSRAARNLIAYNRLTDEPGGRASYELEFPNGGRADVIGNVIQQGRQTANSVMVSFGAEGYTWPSSRLRMSHNTLANDHPHGGSFVRAAPGAELVLLLGNLLVGRGKLDLPADAVLDRNQRLDSAALAHPGKFDYRLRVDARAGLEPLPMSEPDKDLWPRFEYRHPGGVVPIDAPTRLPGALQSPP